MSVKNKNKAIPDNSTQRFLPFSQIRDNVIIMKDDSVRSVMKCSTVNFLLKSEEEQDSIIISFQRFLNSLKNPIQIIVRSTKLDIDGYLSKLNDLAVKQTNPLLQNQTYEYISYLKKLIEVAQIMKKDFYIVVPFDEEENKSIKDDSFLGPIKNFWKSVFKNSIDVLKIKSQLRNYAKMKKGLLDRTNSIKIGLESIGIKSNVIEKGELIKFLTDYYNPNIESYNTIKMDTDYNLIK
ncbi:hypothetical protein CSA08_01825 [Candidatus Gracilibacteria bacterium]|nr:MAG: hypothetical protein CSA08_01825 [Candidatus Gracilibacteria bacterium]